MALPPANGWALDRVDLSLTVLYSSFFLIMSSAVAPPVFLVVIPTLVVTSPVIAVCSASIASYAMRRI